MIAGQFTGDAQQEPGKEIGVRDRQAFGSYQSVSSQISVEDLLCVPLWRVPGTQMPINVSQTQILVKTIGALGAKLVYEEVISSIFTSMA